MDDRPRVPSRIGGCNGDDVAEFNDRSELARNKFMPGSAKDNELFANAALGEGADFEWPRNLTGLVAVFRRCSAPRGPCSFEGMPCSSGVLDCKDARGVAGLCGGWACDSFGGGSFTGSGNSELRFLLRRGSLKKVVCVDTVCVVVVVEP